MTIDVHVGDNLDVLRTLPSASAHLVYIDPPFNTGRVQSRTRTRVRRDAEARRVGFAGRRYASETLGEHRFDDRFDDYLGFLAPRLEELVRVLVPTGSLLVHLDPRESHYVKVHLDRMLGRACFQNELVWAYDYGARSKRRWSAKHDVILWYTLDPRRYTYRYEDIDRVPYLAPGLVGPEKAARGKTPTDVWWHTIVSPTGRERTGWPTQKPLAILERLVRVHSNPGETVLDAFAGSGTTGEAAARLGRDAVLVERDPEAVAILTRRLERWEPRLHLSR